MSVLNVVAVLCVLVPVVSTPLLAAGPARAAGRSGVARRLRLAAAALVDALGRVPTAVAVLLAACGAVVVLCWPLGEALAALEHAVDEPVLHYVLPRTEPGLQRIASFYTALGDRTPLKVVSVVAAVGFAALWRRRWWIPVVAMLGQFAVEQYVQEILALTVDRGHPPTGLGTYPSGGVARIVLTFGMIGVLADLTWRLRPRARVVIATVVAVAAVVEGYSRIYVGKHWLTDVVGGLVFGPLLLLGVAAAVIVLAGHPRAVPPRDTEHPPGGGPAAVLGGVRR